MKNFHAHYDGPAEFLLWMLLVMAVAVYIGMREDKNARGW